MHERRRLWLSRISSNVAISCHLQAALCLGNLRQGRIEAVVFNQLLTPDGHRNRRGCALPDPCTPNGNGRITEAVSNYCGAFLLPFALDAEFVWMTIRTNSTMTPMSQMTALTMGGAPPFGPKRRKGHRLLRRTSDDTRWGTAAFGWSVFEGLSNIASLAAIEYVFLRLWETFQ